MERKTTKMLALVAVIGLCAVALIGAAYAAFGGVASTYNEGNKVDAGYMTLAPSGESASARWAAITAAGSESFSTYTYVTVGGTQEAPTYTEAKAYYFATGGTDAVISESTYKVKQIGAAKEFTIDNQTGAAIASINFKATATANPTAGDFKYFLKVTVGSDVTYLDISTTTQQTGTKTLAIESGSTGTVSVAICVGYIPDVKLPAAPMVGPATVPVSPNVPDAIETGDTPIDLALTSFAFEVGVVA